MPWRSEVSIDAVEYSSRDPASGPAPQGDDILIGDVAELTVGDTTEKWTIELQFWRRTKADLPVQNASESAAGFLAWQLGGKSGKYGVFDGYESRVWLGERSPTIGNQRVDYVDIGEDWRDKFFWNDFVDLLDQYPDEQDGPLQTAEGRRDLAPKNSVREPVFTVSTTNMAASNTWWGQLWRRPKSQTVFVAVAVDFDDEGFETVWRNQYGLLGRTAIQPGTTIPLSLDEETFAELYRSANDLRTGQEYGLEHVN